MIILLEPLSYHSTDGSVVPTDTGARLFLYQMLENASALGSAPPVDAVLASGEHACFERVRGMVCGGVGAGKSRALVGALSSGGDLYTHQRLKTLIGSKPLRIELKRARAI